MLDVVLRYSFMATQIIAIAIIAVEIIYVSFQKPSKSQNEFSLLLFTTLIMLVGYAVELFATNVETALVAAAFSYIGKPFSMITAFIFISNYCGFSVPKKISVPLCVVGSIFPILVFTNGVGGADDPGHHLYYATVEYSPDLFSPLSKTNGPLYFLYMVFIIVMFVADIILIVFAFNKAKSKQKKQQLVLFFLMIFSAIFGYAVYLTGVTKGYDTTMTGSAVGSFFLTVVFFKYNILDSLTTAKDHALDNASNGLLVFDKYSKVVYKNKMVEDILKTDFKVNELDSVPGGASEITKNNRIYDISCNPIIVNDDYNGKSIEITDNTVKHNYRLELEREVLERTQELKNVQAEIISSFATIVERRDNSTGYHIKRMSHYVVVLAKALKYSGVYADVLTDEYIKMLYEVAPLHDIGKLSIPDYVLLKPGSLTHDEYEIIKTHAEKGGEIIRECLGGVETPEYVNLAENVAHYHHEKWDGTGYPCGLKGEDIPLCARIVAVADVYDAIRSERCYKPPMNKEQAKNIILEGKGTHFDPKVVDAFCKILPEIESFQV